MLDKSLNIVESVVIRHTAFENISGKLDKCYRHASRSTSPSCIAITSESRTGKTTVIDDLVSKYPQKRTDEVLLTPIIKVSTPSKPTVKGLVEIILAAIGDPIYWQGTEMQKTIRLKGLMEQTETRMIIIDEFQHFVDKGSKKVMHQVADWLKVLVDDTKVALVVAGLPSCLDVMEQNEQLRGRFSAQLNLPRFNWVKEDDREEFLSILATFYSVIGEKYDLPELHSDEIGFRCYAATGGLIGYLVHFLRQAVWNALDDNKKIITFNDIRTAYREAVWQGNDHSKSLDPFGSDIEGLLSASSLDEIQKIGKHDL